MPYMLVGKCVHKQNSDGSAGDMVPGGCHDTEEEAKNHMAALYANVKDSVIVEMSMRISKASYNKSEPNAMRWTAIDSDVEDDLYHEKMSPELYKDFVTRIENKTPIPAPFDQVICEGSDWCGGTPYLSIAHYKAGTSRKNVPGDVESVFIDGNRLKSKGILHNNDLGRAVWEKLREDMYIKEKSVNPEHLPIRISIGFLDLEHKHLGQATDFTFVRKNVGEICPLCAQGIGGKIYTKGQLVHLAMTRVPVNPRTEMSVERSMDEIQTKRQDAESIVGKLADELEEKSIPGDMLVVRAEDGSVPVSEPYFFSQCYDPNSGKWDQACIDATMNKFMTSLRGEIGTTVKSLMDEVVEDAKRKDVTEADKKHAEKKYGDVKYADETNKKYPIDTEEHVRAALSYWGMPKNREKYSAEDQKKIGGRIHSAAKKFGINVTDKKSDTVEESTMANETNEVEVKEESVLGIPEKPFTYAGLDGNGANNIPSPVKSKKADDEEDAKDQGDDEEMEKSFAQLKSLVKSGAPTEKINEAFGNLGTSVEKSYQAVKASPNSGVDYNAIGEIVRSALAPLQVKIAELEGKIAKGGAVSTEQIVKSKALTFSGYPTQEALIQRAAPQPTRKLTQIEQIALKSTGAIK